MAARRPGDGVAVRPARRRRRAPGAHHGGVRGPWPRRSGSAPKLPRWPAGEETATPCGRLGLGANPPGGGEEPASVPRRMRLRRPGRVLVRHLPPRPVPQDAGVGDQDVRGGRPWRRRGRRGLSAASAGRRGPRRRRPGRRRRWGANGLDGGFGVHVVDHPGGAARGGRAGVGEAECRGRCPVTTATLPARSAGVMNGVLSRERGAGRGESRPVTHRRAIKLGILVSTVNKLPKVGGRFRGTPARTLSPCTTTAPPPTAETGSPAEPGSPPGPRGP
ncbi:hypothetical protein STANM309S_04476 [Streptomyces tanashiensis]